MAIAGCAMSVRGVCCGGGVARRWGAMSLRGLGPAPGPAGVSGRRRCDEFAWTQLPRVLRGQTREVR